MKITPKIFVRYFYLEALVFSYFARGIYYVTKPESVIYFEAQIFLRKLQWYHSNHHDHDYTFLLHF